MNGVRIIFVVSLILYLLTTGIIYLFEDKWTEVDNRSEIDIDPIVYISEEVTTATTEEIKENDPVQGPVPLYPVVYDLDTSEYIVIEPETELTIDEMELIALITMAEAEGECELGKRLVIDTILNRRDSLYFPDTIEGVIYQENAFECLYNGRVDRCYVMGDIVQLVREEAIHRKNYDVLFFCAGDYSIYGTPLFKVDHHYFSTYEEGSE